MNDDSSFFTRVNIEVFGLFGVEEERKDFFFTRVT